MVQREKNCSWIFLYGGKAVTLHLKKAHPVPPQGRAPPPSPPQGGVVTLTCAKQVRSTFASGPFQVRSLYRRYKKPPSPPRGSLLDSSAGYWAIRKRGNQHIIQTYANIIINTCEASELWKNQNRVNRNCLEGCTWLAFIHNVLLIGVSIVTTPRCTRLLSCVMYRQLLDFMITRRRMTKRIG